MRTLRWYYYRVTGSLSAGWYGIRHYPTEPHPQAPTGWVITSRPRHAWNCVTDEWACSVEYPR